MLDDVTTKDGNNNPKCTRRTKGLDTAQMRMIHRVASTGCPIDEKHVRDLYLTSSSRHTVPLPIAIRNRIGQAWKPRDIKQMITDPSHAKEARGWLACLFAFVFEQLELCRSVEEEIKVPSREALKLEKLLLGMASELRKLGCPASTENGVGECWGWSCC